MKRKTEREQDDEQNELALDVPRKTDTMLVVGMQRGDESALREFCERFLPLLLDQARRIGIARDDRTHIVMEFLDDFALRIATGDISFTSPSFVVKAFRNHVIDLWRKDRQDLKEEDALCMLSDFALHAAQRSFEGRTDGDENGLPCAVDRMAKHLFSLCTSDEQNLVVWVSHGVPLRQISEWLGVNYSAVKVRWHRLRGKLRDATFVYVEASVGKERLEIERFLRYAGVLPNEHSATLGGGKQIHA